MSSSMRISKNERDFIEAAVHQGFRVDGRRLLDSRPLRITFLGQDGTVEVQQGQTRILAIMSAQLDAPSLDHPNEGSLAIFTEFSPMADPSFEPGRPRELAIELGRVIDRGLRQSRALDTESLCILTGDTVWALRLDLHVLDNCGNLLDAANAAALAALLSFQIPANILGGIDSEQEVIIDPAKVKELHPLTLHHWPVAVTFGFYGEGKVQLLDPNLKEEAAMQGRMTLTLNGHGEICSIQKAGGVGLTTKEIMSCLQVACTKASSMIDIIKRAVETHNEERVLRNASQYWNALHTIAADEILEGTGKEHILTTLLSHENSFVKIGRPIKSKMVDIESSDVSDEDDAYDIHLREELLDTQELANHLSAGCIVGQLKRNSDTSSGDLDTQTLSPHDSDALEEFRAVAESLANNAASQRRRRDCGTKIVVKECNDMAASLRQTNISQNQDLSQIGTSYCDPLHREENQLDMVNSNSVNALKYQESQKIAMKVNQNLGAKPCSLLDAVKRKPKR